MKKLFVPDMYIQNYNSLNLEKLKMNGIKVLMCDIDNTLAAFDDAYMNADVEAFLERVESSGIKPLLISNNTTRRVSTYVGEHSFAYEANALKPLPYIFHKVRRKYHITYQEMALMGDQLLTDISGAKNLGIYAILSTPLVKRDIGFTKINRIIELYLYKNLEKKNYLHKGVYYE